MMDDKTMQTWLANIQHDGFELLKERGERVTKEFLKLKKEKEEFGYWTEFYKNLTIRSNLEIGRIELTSSVLGEFGQKYGVIDSIDILDFSKTAQDSSAMNSRLRLMFEQLMFAMGRR